MAFRNRLLLVIALLPASLTMRAQPGEELGLSGYVLAPDGVPVSGGSVVIQSRGVRATSSIDGSGRFRLVPDAPGLHQLFVSVSGLQPYRVSVAVPPSRTLRLPVIHLSPATYFRVRFVSAAGEPVTSPRLRRESLDLSGNRIPEAAGDRIPDQIDGDGTITIGPLPRSITTLVLDTPRFAQTRLPDLYITGAQTLLDGGTVMVQPGTVLHVDVVDETGAPVPGHDVFLEDVLPMSPLAFWPVRTNQQGRATFDRLGAGRYRVRTAASARCGNQLLSAVSVVSVSGSGMGHTRLAVGGNATFRITSALGPLRGTMVSASPDVGPSSSPAALRGRLDQSPLLARPGGLFTLGASCRGGTGTDGRVTFTNFPPGPARIGVPLLYSTYVRRVEVPVGGGEIAIAIPDGFLPVRVTNAITNEPVGVAAVAWTGSGGRVEATTSGNGETLLEGVGTAGGTLAVAARGYQPVEESLAEPPAIQHEVALQPAPATSVQARVITASGAPLANAVVQLSSENPIEVGQVAVTEAKGSVTFSDAPPGVVQLMASAEGFVTTAMRIAQDRRTGIVLTLSRGYRVIAAVELPAGTGPHLVRVVNEAGVTMEGLLDIASERRIESPGRISLGPLAPGDYVLELRGPRELWQERVRIVDRDVHVTLR